MAARYLRTLATVEKLAWLGNESETRRLLASIDAEEACELADEIEAEPVSPSESASIVRHRRAQVA